MPRVGLVLRLIEDDHAVISTSLRGVCENCSESSSCSLESDNEKEPVEIVKAVNHLQAQPGDTVEFDLAGHTELKLSLMVWVGPLIGLIGGALLGATYHHLISLSQDTGTLLGAMAGFFAAFLVLMIYDRRHADSPELIPHILRVTQSSCTVSAPQPKKMEV